MGKLNQIIAVEKGAKTHATAEISDLYKAVQKPALFVGFQRTYEKKDDDGEDFPPERQVVQFRATDIVARAITTLSDLFSVTARKDWTNGVAKADIEVDGKTILSDVPVTYLLFLEKQITDIRTFVSSLPTLDVADDWKLNENDGLYKTDVVYTNKGKKIQRPLVLYPATPEHPAQTQIVTEDVNVGKWANVKHSGAIPGTEKQALVARVEKLLRAVKEAREAANSVEEVTTPDVGKAVFSYVFGS